MTTPHPQTLHELSTHIAEHFRFDTDNYKKLPDDAEEARLFALRHMKDHMSKSVGAMATMFEASDHSGNFPPENDQELKQLTVKMLINTLKMAEILDVSPNQLLEDASNMILKVNKK